MGEPLPDDQNSRGATDRPDWLVGADEGVEAEKARNASPDKGPQPFRLIVPVRSDEDPPPATERPRLVQPGGAEAPRIVGGQKPAPAAPAKPVAWTAAASSIPALRGANGAPPIPITSAPVRPAPAAPQEPAPSARGAAPLDSEPRWTEGSAFADRGEEEEREFPDDASDPILPNTPSGGRGPLSPPRESWWVIALDALRSDLRVQIVLAVVAIGIAAWCVWPRADKGVSLATIRHHPERFDNARVFVRGKVGEVFSLGGGYSYYLHQGRDTLVVFTRGAMPRTQKPISVHGTIQMGFLDGIPRQALFADAE